MSTYLYSVLALLLGPVIYAWGRRRPTTKQILDGFVFITVAGIVCVYIIPEAFSAGGTLAAAFLLLGLVFPVALEKVFRRSLHRAHVFIVILAAVGLVIHAVIDGIALLAGNEAPVAAGSDTDSSSILGNQLAIGVILHRLPVGMAIWWSVRPSFGTLAALTTFALLIAATGIAYFFGAAAVELAEQQSLGYFQAFVAGSLVHVVAFGIDHEHEDTAANDKRFVTWGFRAGVLLGLFLLFALPYLN